MVRLCAGRGPANADEVAINAGLAELGGFKLGQPIDVLTLQPRQTFTIVGIYGFSNGRGTLGGQTQVAFVEPVAQRLMLGKTGLFSSLTVTAKPGVSRTELRDQVSAVLGTDNVVRTGDKVATTTAANGGQFLSLVRLVLLGFSGCACSSEFSWSSMPVKARGIGSICDAALRHSVCSVGDWAYRHDIFTFGLLVEQTGVDLSARFLPHADTGEAARGLRYQPACLVGQPVTVNTSDGAGRLRDRAGNLVPGARLLPRHQSPNECGGWWMVIPPTTGRWH
jgi:hypothetical protein